ncbi:tyrosine-type recombinase/integrase [Stutzerimonas xanthomarina]|uniref:phage integrase n=1 Tax=Stutzerimonas xanthomarina TaxID=271420 RepID=UPI00391817E6
MESGSLCSRTGRWNRPLSARSTRHPTAPRSGGALSTTRASQRPTYRFTNRSSLWGTCRAKCSESNDWAPRPKDKRRLSELVELWFDLHGVSLSDGVRRVAILVPVTPELVAAIKKHWQTYGPFTNCIGVFRLVLLSTSIKPPRGQASHILRHTFAAHFIMGGGHIVTLKEILGHASLNMTMRYAHLAPEHLHDAIRLGPLAGITLPLASQ